MDEWKKTLISPDMTICKAIETIDQSSRQIAVVTDDEGRLLGTVTDGDIRRGILKKIPLSSPVSLVMNPHPVAIPKMDDPKSVVDIMKANKIRHLPVIDEERRVIGIELLEERLYGFHYDNWVVIMAGGRGKRLSPLTDDCPKPMLKIGGKPVLQTILEEFVRQGFKRFCISVNYRPERIKDCFGDGTALGAQIHYIEEKRPMGTAGCLSLFPFKTQEPVIVLNGDVLTKLRFEQLVGFHKEHRAKATVAVAAYDFQAPYGLIKTNRHYLAGFEEKPVFSGFINAGVYVLNPELPAEVPKNCYYDMSDLIKSLLEKREPVCVFPIREYWIDIGTSKSFAKACAEYDSGFNPTDRRDTLGTDNGRTCGILQAHGKDNDRDKGNER